MNLRYQRGELRLIWSAAIFGVLAFVAIAALLIRYERNFFSDAWRRITHTAAGQTVQRMQQSAADAIKSEPAVVRKCVVAGKIIYSNVECDSGSRQVELHDSHGIEPPKAPPVDAVPVDMHETLREKAIEKTLAR